MKSVLGVAHATVGEKKFWKKNSPQIHSPFLIVWANVVVSSEMTQLCAG
jgi:hypothetical protein